MAGGVVNAAILQEIADELGVDVVYVEKDWLLTEIIRTLASGPQGDNLVLKGGQALRHIHGSLRLSKDADYVARRRFAFEELRAALSIRHPRLTLPEAPVGRTRHGFRVRPIAYRGPLGIQDSVELEVSFREDLVREPLRSPYLSPFHEPFLVLVMDPNEMVAEKIRALYQRGNPRDLFDLHFIFSHPTLRIDPADVVNMLPRKFAPGLVAGGWDRGRLYDRIGEMAPTWHTALAALAPQHPSFNEAQAVVEKALKFLPR